MRIDSRGRAVLAELELTSNGVTPNPGGSGGGHPSSSEPRSGDPDPPHLRHRERLVGAGGVENYERALRAARAELEAISRRQAPLTVREESASQLAGRIIIEGEGWTVKDVARAMRCLERTVLQARKNAGRDPAYGLRGRSVSNGTDPAVSAREMCARGVSTRLIAESLGAHQTQVMRWLRSSQEAA